jgi:hypothetical protein
MKEHLEDEQVVAAVLCESDRSTLVHAMECPGCREDLRTLHQAIDTWKEDVGRATASRSEGFWLRQRQLITAGHKGRQRMRAWKRLAWATAVAMLILLAVSLHRPQPPRPPAPAPIDDNALLMNVQASVSSDVPEALQPVDLLTQDMERAEEARRNTAN